MKNIINILFIITYFQFIRTRISKVTEDIVVPHVNDKTHPITNKPTKAEDSVSSSSEDDGILIKISDKRNRTSTKTQKNERETETTSDKKTKTDKQHTTESEPSHQLHPFNYNNKKKQSKTQALPTTPTSKPFAFTPLESTYKTPTTDFLLKNFESKTTKVEISEKEINELKDFSLEANKFIPILSRVNDIIKNLIKVNEKEAEKPKQNKPSELFNIKVIEVSDNAHTN